VLRPVADGAGPDQVRRRGVGAAHSGQWKPTEAVFMHRAQILRSHRWHRTPARLSGCQWQVSVSDVGSIGRTVPAAPVSAG